MILYQGKIYPSQEQNGLLEDMEGAITTTLQRQAPEAETVIAACDGLARQVLDGAFDTIIAGLGLDRRFTLAQAAAAASLLRRDSGLRRPCPLCRIRLYRRLRTARQKSGCHHCKDELPRSVHSSILPHLPQPDRAAGSVCPDCITPSGGRQFPLCGPPRPLFC